MKTTINLQTFYGWRIEQLAYQIEPAYASGSLMRYPHILLYFIQMDTLFVVSTRKIFDERAKLKYSEQRRCGS